MDLPVIILDSDDEDIPAKEAPKEEAKQAIKRPAANESNGTDASSSKIRRVQPTKIGEVRDKTSSKDESDSDTTVIGSTSQLFITAPNANEDDANGDAGPSTSSTSKDPGSKNELTPHLEKLIAACRDAERSDDMKKVIKSKLLKYYHSVHPDYVTSKNFLKTLKSTTEEIQCEPHLVYTKLKAIIEELEIRSKSKATVFTNEESIDVKGTGDEAKDAHLKKLYKALYKLKRHITDLEEAEVDWDDDDNSSYLKKVRFEKRACEIYEKICDITGESTHAHRIVRKPINFKGTDFQEFNKKLTKIVNKKNAFPNFLDVLKCLDYCNKKHNFGLKADQLKAMAQDAFQKLGKKLQERRKTDLYETTTFYAGKTKDPAKENPELRIQLEKNKKFYGKYDDIINEYAEKENKTQSDDADEVSSTSKGEQPAVEPKEEAVEDEPEDLLVDCDNINVGATKPNFEEQDDLMILS